MKRSTIFILFFLGLGLALLFSADRHYRSLEEERTQVQLQNAAELTQRRITQAFSLRLNAVEDLKAFLLATPTLPDSAAFDRYAGRSLDQYPTVSALQFADPDFIIRYVYPLQGNEAALNHDLRTRSVNTPSLEKVLAQKITVTSNPFQSIQGRLAIVVRAPLYVNDTFIGLAQELFDVNKTAAELFDDLSGDYAIQLSDSDGTVFWSNGSDASGPHTTVTIPIGDNFWQANITLQQPHRTNPYVLSLLWGLGPLVLILLSLLLHQQFQREERLQAAVQEKTLDLQAKNTALLGEIEERIRAESALRHSEEKYARVFRDIADIVGITRLKDRSIIEVNTAFHHLLGYSPSETIGYSSLDLNLWADEEERDRLYTTLRRGEPVRKLETQWRMKNGQIRWGLLSADRIFIEDEPCLLFVWSDINDRKQAETALLSANQDLEARVEQRTLDLQAVNQELQAVNLKLQQNIDNLRQTQEQLIQSEKLASLGRLVAGIAHEVNTPLGVALTAATHLQKLNQELHPLFEQGPLHRQTLDHYVADIGEAATIVQSNLERAAHLIRSFKQVSADQNNEVRRKFRLHQYLEEIFLSLHPKLKRTSLTIQLNCSMELEWDGYPGAFGQVITNLIMNSLTHAYDANSTGTLEVQVKKTETHILLTYSDDGKGMTPEVREHIFDPFFTTRRNHGGTGLGLYLVYNIVTQQCGGSIRCESEPNKGSRFFICLPFSAPQQPLPTPNGY